MVNSSVVQTLATDRREPILVDYGGDQPLEELHNPSWYPGW
jgi:hypothetical protein